MTVEFRKVRFKKEKNAPYRPEMGSFESVLVEARDICPGEAYTMGSSDSWVEIEKRASMSCEQGCFQYFLAGVGHLELAERIVNRLNVSVEDREQRISDIADFIYDKYPQKYKDQIKR